MIGKINIMVPVNMFNQIPKWINLKNAHEIKKLSFKKLIFTKIYKEQNLFKNI